MLQLYVGSGSKYVTVYHKGLASAI